MKMKKYMDIQRMHDNWTDIFNVGDEIWIEEKIDGANCGIRYDSENDKLVAQSRNRILEVGQDDLRGFGTFVERLNANPEQKRVMVEEIFEGRNDLILFGEWACKHTITYPDDVYNKMYCYDMYDMSKEAYLPQDEVYTKITMWVGMVPLNTAPVFYEGVFIDWEHINKFIGRSNLGGSPSGEGIVIKNQTRLNDPDYKRPFYIKIVTEQFKEVQKSNKVKKSVDPSELAAEAANIDLAKTIITEARVRKILNKFIDEGILREGWDQTDMPIVSKNLGKRIIEDCIKEEPQIVEQVTNFSKLASKISIAIARTIVLGR